MKALTKKFMSYILVIMVSSGGFFLWAHDHSSKLQLSNKSNVKQLVMGSEINREIRAIENRCHDLKMEIERKRSDLLRVQLNPGQGDHILELKNRLQNEIEDSQRELERQKERLRSAESKEQALIDRLHTA